MKYLILVAFFCLLLIKIDGRIKYDLLKNQGKLNIKIVGYKIICAEFNIKNGYIIIKNKNGKSRLVPIELTDTKQSIDTDIELIILKRMTINQATIFVNFGLKDEPFVSAIISGLIIISSQITFSFLQLKKHRVETITKVYSNFKYNIMKFGTKLSLSISVLDVLSIFVEYIFVNKILRISNKSM